MKMSCACTHPLLTTVHFQTQYDNTHYKLRPLIKFTEKGLVPTLLINITHLKSLLNFE
jgi:hypothetical protein